MDDDHRNNTLAELRRQLTWLTLIANLPANAIADASPELSKKFERKKVELFSSLTTVERLEDLFEHSDLSSEERKIILRQVIDVTSFYRHCVRAEIVARDSDSPVSLGGEEEPVST